MPDLTNLIGKLKKPKKGDFMEDALTADFIGALVDSIKGLARGDNVFSGANVRKRSGSASYQLSADRGGLTTTTGGFIPDFSPSDASERNHEGVVTQSKLGFTPGTVTPNGGTTFASGVGPSPAGMKPSGQPPFSIAVNTDDTVAYLHFSIATPPTATSSGSSTPSGPAGPTAPTPTPGPSPTPDPAPSPDPFPVPDPVPTGDGLSTGGGGGFGGGGAGGDW